MSTVMNCDGVLMTIMMMMAHTNREYASGDDD